VTRGEALRRIKATARDRKLVFSHHAYEKMDVLGETEASVTAALRRATTIAAQPGRTWRVFGGGLTCVVALRGDVVVVTLFV